MPLLRLAVLLLGRAILLLRLAMLFIESAADVRNSECFERVCALIGANEFKHWHYNLCSDVLC